METSDSSHSGIVAGANWRLLDGLEGAEAAIRGWRNDFREVLARESQSALRLELNPLDFGEDNGGVTGALFDILRGGRL